MKIRITYRKKEDGLELTVDTDSINQPIYTKLFKTEEQAKQTINNILSAAKIDNNVSIDFEDKDFGDLLFDTDLDFTNENDYQMFCNEIMVLELKK